MVKVVQEYERAVVFRLGRMLTGKARGPGVFFVIPCIDMYEKIDLRTQSYDVPPQEVVLVKTFSFPKLFLPIIVLYRKNYFVRY